MARIAARPGCPHSLAEAMGYALLGPGKRLRPLLTLAAVRACGGEGGAGLDAGCAVEFVHAYSLIHDDLPAMDDDDLRRGRPTCHRKFGEALAILAGDALLTHAFEVLVEGLPADRAAEGCGLLARAAGASGMVGGQVDDVAADVGEPVALTQVEAIHLRKTARLMQVALELGALCTGVPDAARQCLIRYGRALGLAFQVADDVLAAAGDAAALGRNTGSDEVNQRRTVPRAVGLAAARQRASELLTEAGDAARALGPGADVLHGLVELVGERAGI
jgi:geranylgeranyl diphosphate synthase type II